MTGTLSRIQELFHLHSDFKDGPKAGKVNDEQLKTGKFALCILTPMLHSRPVKWPVCLRRTGCRAPLRGLLQAPRRGQGRSDQLLRLHHSTAAYSTS